MCGRIALFTPPQRLARLLEAALAAGVDPDGQASWNVGPQRELFGVADRGDGRVLDEYRWGLVPWWSKDATQSARSFNARAETVATRPTFRDAFERHRLLVPVDGFFEWDRHHGRVPHYFSRADGEVLVLAGLYDTWREPDAPRDAPRLRTCTIVTTTPGPDLDGIHDRMPVVLEPDRFELWLTADPADEKAPLLDLLGPAPAGTLVHHEVDRRVGNVANDGPELIAASAGGGDATLF